MSTAGNNKRTTSRQERLMMEALDIINGSRRAAYGPPERNFERIATLWGAYLAIAIAARPGDNLSARDVCHMLDLVKLARLVETPDHEDSIRDRFGYQGCYVDLVYGDKPVVEATAGEWQGPAPTYGEGIGGVGDPGWQDWPPAVEPIMRDDCDAPVPKFESRLRPLKSNGA